MFGGVEFPVINYEHYSGKKYDHFWGVGFGAIFQDRIYHVQFSTLQRHVWKVEGYSPSEPLFVPNPDSQAEDDGIILSLVSPFSNTLLRVSYTLKAFFSQNSAFCCDTECCWFVRDWSSLPTEWSRSLGISRSVVPRHAIIDFLVQMYMFVNRIKFEKQLYLKCSRTKLEQSLSDPRLIANNTLKIWFNTTYR